MANKFVQIQLNIKNLISIKIEIKFTSHSFKKIQLKYVFFGINWIYGYNLWINLSKGLSKRNQPRYLLACIVCLWMCYASTYALAPLPQMYALECMAKSWRNGQNTFFKITAKMVIAHRKGNRRTHTYITFILSRKTMYIKFYIIYSNNLLVLLFLIHIIIYK